MHKFISQDEALMTRFVMLENLETGTMDECFDDSDAAPGGKDFYFMEEGKNYRCRIELFGDVHCGPVGTVVECRVVNKDVMIGQWRMVEVAVGKDIYYVPRKEVEEYLASGEFLYCYTRKDLIQVDDMIHGDALAH